MKHLFLMLLLVSLCASSAEQAKDPPENMGQAMNRRVTGTLEGGFAFFRSFVKLLPKKKEVTDHLGEIRTVIKSNTDKSKKGQSK